MSPQKSATARVLGSAAVSHASTPLENCGCERHGEVACSPGREGMGRWGCCFVGRQQQINPNRAHGALQRGRRFQRRGCGRSSHQAPEPESLVQWSDSRWTVSLSQPIFGLSPPTQLKNLILAIVKGSNICESSQHQALVTWEWHMLLLFRNWVWGRGVERAGGAGMEIELPGQDSPMKKTLVLDKEKLTIFVPWSLSNL